MSFTRNFRTMQGGVQKVEQNEPSVTTIPIAFHIPIPPQVRKFAFLIRKHFPINEVLPYKLKVYGAFSRNVSLLDDIRLPDNELVHDSLVKRILLLDTIKNVLLAFQYFLIVCAPADANGVALRSFR